MDINCSERLEENAGPLGALFQSFSVLYCMTTSLAHHGAGLGTVGLPEAKLSDLCAEAGFRRVRRVRRSRRPDLPDIPDLPDLPDPRTFRPPPGPSPRYLAR